ncbi:hypothetical protein QYF36_019589 [Acer negundo]|nr:hypothetical protein QYF36_019589 [Acer negundo]
MFPVMDKLIKALCTLAKDNAHVSMLSRTHGQPASPTTLGKEMSVFAVRLSRERQAISQVMRRYGVPEPYEKLKELTRGKTVNNESIREFTLGLELPEEAKANLLELTPHSYVGAAVELARNVDAVMQL